MNLSGILVVAKPEWLDTVIAELKRLPGLEVHQTDPASGRIVVVQEAPDIRAEMAALKTIKALPHVVLAEMVYHYIAEDEQMFDELPPELQAQEGQACAIPTYLQD